MISHTALDDLPFKKPEKDKRVRVIRRFKYRTRYFTDSGIIGSKAFVSEAYEVFKDRFFVSRERAPRRVRGIGGCIP